MNKTITTIISLVLISTLSRAQDYDATNTSSRDAFEWPEGKKMALSLTFDDARISQVEKGIPLLNTHGITATFYVSPEAMLQRKEDWKNAVGKGHDIGNHTLLHPCSGNFAWARHKALEEYTPGSMAIELDSASALIKEALGIWPSAFAYTCGQSYIGRGVNTRSYVPVVAARFETGRDWMNEGPNDPVYCDLARLNGTELDGKSFSEALELIIEARKQGAWLVFAGHETDTGGVQTSLLSTIDSICMYAADPANGIWIDNVTSIGRYLRKTRGLPGKVVCLPYKDPALPVESRVEDLISRMTLEEKIGQLNMPCVYENELGNNIEEKKEGARRFAAGTFMKGIGPGGGFFTLPNNILPEGPEQQAMFHNELQSIALHETRLGIPLLQTEEGTHGFMCSGGTIFPEGPALGSTWNLDLLGRIYSAAAREARATGIHQLFTLVIEPIRDPRLGRNEEAYSEDPFLTSRVAETIVRAVQGNDVSAKDKVVAGLCHFPGQSQPASGLERGAMEISERALREIFLPSWEAGIKKAGALGVMATYPAIDGIPVHGSKEILTGILREELGFQGLVLSEGGGVNTLVYTGRAANMKDAAALAALAGMDVSISFGQGYYHEMVENVKEGKVSMEVIDRAVRRILTQKFKLGLFGDPFVDPAYAVSVSHNPAHQALALEAARESIVLLKNEDQVLPLDRNKISSIAVIGPNANDDRNQLGDYVSKVVLQDITTVFEGIQMKADPGTRISHVTGCHVTGEDLNEIGKAVKAARRSDVAIVVLGENEWRKAGKQGTSGEGYDVATLELTGLQSELVEAVHATGTPVVVILINGRPLATPWIEAHVPAIIEAWIPGEKGGEAVAEILFGEVNPSGKLPVTVPRHAGQLPVYYNHKPSKDYWLKRGWGNSYADMGRWPLFPFGHGLSYTNFEYENLDISPSVNGSGGTFKVSLEIQNTGPVAGAEVVQLYIRDQVSSAVRPVKELKGFSKIMLEPGERKTVTFHLGFAALKFLDKDMNWTVEPGDFTVMIGSSSEDIRLENTLTVLEQ